MAPMTNAERQKKYRDKLKQNPEAYEEKKKKHREYMKAVRKPIADLTEKEKEKKRREWRNAKKIKKDGGVTKQKKNKCCALAARQCLILAKQVKYQKNVIETILLQKRALQKQIYRQKIKIRKLCDAPTKSDTNNKIISQEITVNDSFSLPDSLETKPYTGSELADMNIPYSSSDITTTDKSDNDPISVELFTFAEPELTPMTKTLSFINENIPSISTPEKNKVKKQILQLNVMNTSLQTSYQKQNNKSKQILKDIVSSEIVQKYNLKTEISKSLGLKGRVRKFKKKDRIYKEAREIKDFFNRDDATRMTAGKKESIGRGNDKVQKRLLLSSMKKLHTQYLSQGGKASFSTFRRNKPKNVVRPKLSDRNTVACIKHSNLAFKTAYLKRIGVIGTADLEELLASIVCSIDSYDCMYLNCDKCKDNIPEMTLTEITNETECKWIQWSRKTYTFEKGLDKKLITTKKYVKEIATGKFKDLKKMFLADLLIFRKHFFNINHQHKQYRTVIDNLLPNEIALIIDFSENYSCKLGEEIQSLHFGASKGQITIHTGMAYLHTKKIPFASLADCNNHDPGAIRAHMEPILDFLIKDNSNIDTIHIFSDGPSTQYKQKKNFYQFTDLCNKYRLKFGTWSFFEAAHGKGAADGVGGAVKRLLDQNVACGRDVTCAEDAMFILNEESSVKIFLIPENKIKHAQKQIPDDLNPVPGTNQIHQITYHVSKMKLRYRNVSCFCDSLLPRGICECYNTKIHVLKRNLVSKNRKRQTNVGTRKNNNCNAGRSKLTRIHHDSGSTTSTDTNITYAESDESYNIADEQEFNIDNDAEVDANCAELPEIHIDKNDLLICNSDENIVEPTLRDSNCQAINDFCDTNNGNRFDPVDTSDFFAVDDWVVIKYEKDMKVIGQILNKTQYGTYEISCLSYIEPFTFTWHKKWCEDIIIIEVSEANIIHRLSSKVKEHDGCVEFSLIPMWDYN